MNDTVDGSQAALSRRLGVFSSTLAGVGVILGAGIYVLVGVAAGRAGNAVWLSFLVAAAVAAFTAISYARLVRFKPKDAPEFQFLSMAFGQAPGFLAGWLMLWATVISAAAVALGFGGYLEHVIGVPHVLGAIGLIALSSLIVFVGVGQSVLLAGILTFIEVAGIVIIIGIGIPYIGDINLIEMPMGIPGIIGAASLVFFAFLGFEGMANLSEEMKNPERDLPKAMLLALGISTALYMLVAIAAISVLGWQDLSQSGAPLAAVASRIFGDKADLLLTILALGATANTVLLLLFASSRAMWAMSCAGALPMKFCVIGENRRTPWFTIIIVGGLAALFALIKNIESVAEFTNFVTLLVFAGVNAAAMIIFHRDRPGAGWKHFAADIALPGVGLVTSLGLAVITGWRAVVFGAALLIAGILTFLLMRWWNSRGMNPR